MRRKIFASILLSACVWILFSPAVALTAVELEVEYNPICWEEVECAAARSKWFDISGQSAADEGWVEKEVECNKNGWGKCLAGQATKTSIAIGGKKEFTNLGDYIKTIYNYALAALGILAVVIIILSGVQWITSAGNSETISQSKKRIGGAIIGLFIAYMSFNILNSINPALVNLRLPQVWMVREQVLPSKWCGELKPETMFAFAVGGQQQSDEIKATGNETYNRMYPRIDSTSKEFWCGQRFYIRGSMAEQFCWGDRCDTGQVCSDTAPVDKKNPYMCRKTVLAGEIIAGKDTSIVFERWEYPWANTGELTMLCNDGEESMVSDDVVIQNDDVKQSQSYMFSISPEEIEEAVKDCGEEGVKGFFMEWEFNRQLDNFDEQHRIGISGSKGVDIGYAGLLDWDDTYYENLGNLLPDNLIQKEQLLGGLNITIEAGEVIRCVGLLHGEDCEPQYYKYYKPKP